METLYVTVCFEDSKEDFVLVIPRCADFAAVEALTQVLAREDFRGFKVKVGEV